MNITFQEYEYTRSTWDKIPLSANMFLSAISHCCRHCNFIWILHLCFLLLSVCVIVSNAGRDLSLCSNRRRLPLPVARFWGLPVLDWSFSFCLMRAKGWGGGGWKTGGENGQGGCFNRERPPTWCLRFPSVGKRAATYPETLIDACTWALINITIKRARKHTLFVQLKGDDDRAGWHTGWQTGTSSEALPDRSFVHFKVLVSLKPPWALA